MYIVHVNIIVDVEDKVNSTSKNNDIPLITTTPSARYVVDIDPDVDISVIVDRTPVDIPDVQYIGVTNTVREDWKTFFAESTAKSAMKKHTLLQLTDVSTYAFVLLQFVQLHIRGHSSNITGKSSCNT